MKAGDLRTKQQENVIQNLSPEEETFHYFTRDVERRWAYAKQVARHILRNQQLLELTKGWKYAQGMAADVGAIRATVVILEVDESFVDWTVELVKACLDARYDLRRVGWRGNK